MQWSVINEAATDGVSKFISLIEVINNLSLTSLVCPIAVPIGIFEFLIASNNSILSNDFDISDVLPPPLNIIIKSQLELLLLILLN